VCTHRYGNGVTAIPFVFPQSEQECELCGETCAAIYGVRTEDDFEIAPCEMARVEELRKEKIANAIA
jgi:hypothetical protein